MKKVKVDFTLRAVSRKGQVTRYDLNVILKDINANQKVYGKNPNQREIYIILSTMKNYSVMSYQTLSIIIIMI